MTHAHCVLHVPRPSQLLHYISSRLRAPDIEVKAVREILDQYGLELIKPPRNLPTGRRNRNLALETVAGKKLLKGYRPQWQAGTVTYCHSILSRLEQLNFPAPRLVATKAGESFVNQSGQFYALFDFADGINYTANFLLRTHRYRLMAIAGRTLALLHRQLAGFVPQGRHHLGFTDYMGTRRRDIAWYCAKVVELKEESRALSSQEAQTHAGWLISNSDAVLEELSWLDELLSDAPLPRLVIHGDYGIHNLLFQNDGIVMPVDFELARLEWRLSDLVSCLSRFRYSAGVYDFESMRRFMEGYQGEYPLSRDEWALWPQVWRFYKLQGAVQYWNSYFETKGPTRKLISARDAVGQAAWVRNHPNQLLQLI